MKSDKDCLPNPTYLQRHGILEERVIEKTCDSVLVEFTIPQTCDFFDGHFPQIQLFPAVAQIDILFNLAKKYFGTQLFAFATKRTKFMAAIFPNTTVRLFMKLNAKKNSLLFKFFLAPFESNSPLKNSASEKKNSTLPISTSISSPTLTEKIFSCGTFTLAP